MKKTFKRMDVGSNPAESIIKATLKEVYEKIEIPVFCGYRINFNGNCFNILFGFNPPDKSGNGLFYLTSQMYFKYGERRGDFHLYKIPEDNRDRKGWPEDKDLDLIKTKAGFSVSSNGKVNAVHINKEDAIKFLYLGNPLDLKQRLIERIKSAMSHPANYYF